MRAWRISFFCSQWFWIVTIDYIITIKCLKIKVDIRHKTIILSIWLIITTLHNKNIKAFYKRRLFSPIVYIILLTVLWFAFSLGDILSPIHIDDSVSFEAAYKDSDRYVKKPPLKSFTLPATPWRTATISRAITTTACVISTALLYCLHHHLWGRVCPLSTKLTVVGKIVKGKGHLHTVCK